MSKFLRPNKASLKNAQHFAFIQAFITVMQEQGFSAAKITALLTELVTSFGTENFYYMQARTSELVAQRTAADRRRDDFYARLHAIVRAWANSGDPAHEAAANELIKVFRLYKVNTSAQIEEETGQMENLKTDLETTENTARIEALHATWLFQQMCAAHEEVKSIRLQEGTEQSEKVAGALLAARKECDKLYDSLTYLIEAFALAADDPAPYEAFIRKWNGTLKIYQDMLDRKSGTGSTSPAASDQPAPAGTDSPTGSDTPSGTGDTPSGSGDTPSGSGEPSDPIGGSGDQNGDQNGGNDGDNNGGDNGGGAYGGLDKD